MGIKHRLPVRVYYEDTDAGGIVYHANYLKFFERGRTEWLRELGIEQDTLLEQSIAFVVKAMELDFRVAARFNQLLSIESEVVELKRASLLFSQQILGPEQAPMVSAQVQVACINASTMRPQAIPGFIKEEILRVI